MGRKKKEAKKHAEQDILYAKVKDGENYKFVLGVMLETKQSMRAVIEACVMHCRRSKTFKMPVHVTAAEKMIEVRAQREERLKAKVSGE